MSISARKSAIATWLIHIIVLRSLLEILFIFLYFMINMYAAISSVYQIKSWENSSNLQKNSSLAKGFTIKNLLNY
ncbi:unnamed protein product [Blepharisma stoltei]|uniref:ATP synthase F0 subunit 8 n=1 Tax=Blepharisma stoltei TaxID=1481888 RepID=A0AAU9JBQ7_9CILI|nr:unnamed protein product [Blepharisma stoltei]